MGPKKKNEPEPEPEAQADCQMAMILMKYTPKSSNPEVALDPIEISLNINTNSRSDIVIDYVKRVMAKKITEKISDLGGSKENTDTLEFGNFEATAESETKDEGETEQLETKEQAIEKVIEQLKGFQALLLGKSLQEFSFKKVEPLLSDGTASSAEPVVVQADTNVKLRAIASSIFNPMSSYLVGVREQAKNASGAAEEPPKIMYLSTPKT